MTRKILIVLMLFVGGYLWSGCSSTLSVGEIHWTGSSIPEGLFSWDVKIPGFESRSSMDPLKAIDIGIKAIVGMVPIG